MYFSNLKNALEFLLSILEVEYSVDNFPKYFQKLENNLFSDFFEKT